MANPKNLAIDIDLDKPRKLLFDFNALANLEEVLKRSMLEPGALVMRSAGEIRAFLWATLKGDDPTITIEQAGALINAGNMQTVWDALNAAQAAHLPEPEAPKEDAPADPTQPPQ